MSIHPPFMNKSTFALGIIDVQYDFFTGGTLAVPNAESIIEPINQLRHSFHDMLTFFSQDYHPPNHMSFATSTSSWPTHCVQNTHGCNLHKDIVFLETDTLFRKGTNPNVESYSAFGAGIHEDTGLVRWLQTHQITDIIIVGLATDFCVYHTVLDAHNYGFNVHVLLPCTKGVFPETTEHAIHHMRNLQHVFIYKTIDEFTIMLNKSLYTS